MKIMAMLPTYNEAENIQPLIRELLALRDDMEVVVVDDNSPDGTWQLVKEMAATNPRVHLVHRTNEKGRGSAGIAGFLYAVNAGADYIIEMDADFSHHPRFVPALLKAAETSDVVIGSRLVPGGKEVGRGLLRPLITIMANWYIRTALRLPVRDCTSGFRVFRRSVLEQIGLERMTSNGPAIVQEILVACRAKGFSFVEVPIVFEERRAGTSTFTLRIMLDGLWSVLKFRFRRPG
jgi:dolichol-phosphate mannosyltransferase